MAVAQVVLPCACVLLHNASQYTDTMERVLAAARRAFPTSYASRLLPRWMANPGPNTQVTDRAAKQARMGEVELCACPPPAVWATRGPVIALRDKRV